MSSASGDLTTLFERAYELRYKVDRCPQEVLVELNGELAHRRLGGRTVLLANLAGYATKQRGEQRHSLSFFGGRLGSFAIRHADERGPELTALIHDIRGVHGKTMMLPLTTNYTTYDINNWQTENALFTQIYGLLTSPDFSFITLATLCKQIPIDDLNMTLFAIAMNDVKLPHDIATAIYTYPQRTYYYSRGVDVATTEEYPARYALSPSDIFTIFSQDGVRLPVLCVSDIETTSPTTDYRHIIIDEWITGFEKA